MRRFKPANGQQQLPFHLQRSRVLRKLKTATTHEKHLLRVLDDHIGNKTSWDVWLEVGTMADEMCCSERTVERAIQGLQKQEFVMIVGYPRKDRGCRTYRLRRAEMWEAAGMVLRIDDMEGGNGPGPGDDFPPSPGPRTPEPTRLFGESINDPLAIRASRQDSATRQIGESVQKPTRLFGESIAPHIRNEYLQEEEEGLITKPPPPCPALRAPDGAANWDRVKEELIRFPVGDFQSPIDAARSHGCSPPHVLALIEFARTNAARWKSPAGALWKRITNAHPQRAIADAWPEPDQKAVREQQRAKSEAKQFAQLEDDAGKLEANRSSQTALEAEYGEYLDALSDGERAALSADVAQRQGYNMRFCREAPRTLRLRLLRELQRRFEMPSSATVQR